MNWNIQKETNIKKKKTTKEERSGSHPNNNLNFLYLPMCICFTWLSILIGLRHAVVLLMYSEFQLLFSAIYYGIPKCSLVLVNNNGFFLSLQKQIAYKNLL